MYFDDKGNIILWSDLAWVMALHLREKQIKKDEKK